MMFCKLRSQNKDQRGITIVELLVALTIIGFVASGVAMAISQMFSVHASATNRVTAIREVQNAGYWVSHDAHMAQSIIDEDDEETTGVEELLILSWIEWDGTMNKVTYTIVNGELIRTIVKNGDTTVSMVAQFIKSSETSFVLDENKRFLTATLTAEVGGFKQASETRVYEIIPRPSL
jgi:type II secretory pathway pseudopilin PulG